MGGLGYKEVLELVEKLMIDSYIRKYCSEICKGKCCENCYTKNTDSCRHHEGRRLPCSIFLCSDILSLFPATDEKLLRWLNKSIKDQYHIYSRVIQSYANIYFTKPDKVFTKITRFPKKIKNVIGELDTINIKKIMNDLIKAKIKINEVYAYKRQNENK